MEGGFSSNRTQIGFRFNQKIVKKMYLINPKPYKYFTIFLLILVRINCNDILEEREVVCSSDRMVVNLSFRRPFNGIVFVQGQFHNEKCKWRGNGGHYLLVILPMRQSSFCGIRSDPLIGEHSVMLIVSADSHILTQQSLALAVSCVHARKEQSLTLTIGSPSIDSGFRTVDRESISSLLGRAPPIPGFSLQIRDAHGLAGQIINEAAIGQRLTLDAVLNDNTFYDLFVHGCTAHDGSRSPEASVQMIDDNGCAIRLPRAVDGPTMVSPQNENAAGGNGQPKHVFVYFYGFQFTTGPIVHFECQITLCMAPCAVKQCAENSAILGGTSATISTKIVKTQLNLRPQILQPLPRAERLIGEIQSTKSIYAGLVNCTDLAWLLILTTFGVLLCIAIWTIFLKLYKIITGICKAIRA